MPMMGKRGKSFAWLCLSLGLSPMLGAAESLSGIVKDKNTGAPLSGVTVILGEKSNGDKPIIDTVLTGADGIYRFDGLHAITEIGFGFNLYFRLERYAVYVT